MKNRFCYEASYDNGTVQVGHFEPPTLADKRDVVRLLIEREGEKDIDLRFHEQEALDIAIGLLFTLRNLNPTISLARE